MPIQPVVHVLVPGGTSGGTSDPVDTSGADLIVFSTSYFESITPIEDSYDNDWTLGVNQHDDYGVAIYYCLKPTVGPGHTFTTASGFSAGSVSAFSGVSSVGSAVGTRLLDNTFSSVQPGAISVSAGTLLVGSIANNAAPTDDSVEVDSGFILTDQQPFSSGVNFSNAMAYGIAAETGSVNPTFSWSGGAAEVMAGMLSFMPAATPPSGGTTYLGRVRVVGSAPASRSNPFLGSATVVGSAPAGTPDPYLGQIVEVGSAPAGASNPSIGNVTVVGSAPAGDADPFLGSVKNS